MNYHKNVKRVRSVTQHVLCPGRPDDNLSAQRCDTDFHAGVSVLSKFPREKLIKLGVKNTICHELVAQRKVSISRYATQGQEKAS